MTAENPAVHLHAVVHHANLGPPPACVCRLPASALPTPRAASSSKTCTSAAAWARAHRCGLQHLSAACSASRGHAHGRCQQCMLCRRQPEERQSQQSCPEPCSCVPVGTLVLQKPKSKLPVGPVMLGFFLFVVVGSGECCAASKHCRRQIAALHGSACPASHADFGPCLCLCSPHTAILQIIRTATTAAPPL